MFYFDKKPSASIYFRSYGWTKVLCLPFSCQGGITIWLEQLHP